VAVLLAMAPMPGHATSKDMVELQTQVQQLLDMVQRLQSTMDTKFGVVQHLAEQTADNANQMTAAVTALQQKLSTQNDAVTGKLDTSSGQVQSLNDSVDELKSRINKLDKSIQDLQTQLQSMQQATTPSSPGDSSAPSSAPAPAPAPPSRSSRGSSGKPSAGTPLPSVAPAPSAADQGANQAPPLQETYQAGVRDYNAARYDVAAGEFMDVIHYYPLDDLAGNAQFYLGEVAYHRQSYADAVKSYNAVLEGFSGSAKAPAAQLRKGLALILLNKKESGVHELRLLIQRHPQTPEATQARTKLKSMNVAVTGR